MKYKQKECRGVHTSLIPLDVVAGKDVPQNTRYYEKALGSSKFEDYWVKQK